MAEGQRSGPVPASGVSRANPIQRQLSFVIGAVVADEGFRAVDRHLVRRFGGRGHSRWRDSRQDGGPMSSVQDQVRRLQHQPVVDRDVGPGALASLIVACGPADAGATVSVAGGAGMRGGDEAASLFVSSAGVFGVFDGSSASPFSPRPDSRLVMVKRGPFFGVVDEGDVELGVGRNVRSYCRRPACRRRAVWCSQRRRHPPWLMPETGQPRLASGPPAPCPKAPMRLLTVRDQPRARRLLSDRFNKTAPSSCVRVASCWRRAKSPSLPG